MTKDEALKLALEALEDLGMKHFESTGEVLYKETFTVIKEALAQPEHGWTSERIAGIARLKEAQDKKLAQPAVTESHKQEPVVFNTLASLKHKKTVGPIERAMLNATPPQRTWVGLTEDEAFACQGRDYFETYKAIEAKLKEKNT